MYTVLIRPPTLSSMKLKIYDILAQTDQATIINVLHLTFNFSHCNTQFNDC